MTSHSAQAFIESPEAAALTGIPEPDRNDVALRIFSALSAVGTPLEKLGASEAHGWLLHAIPDEFRPRDPLAVHLVPVLRALLDFAERSASRTLDSLRTACEDLVPELEGVLVSGRSHHHETEMPEAPYVRASPKVGRNDPCPCGSGKKFKKCHGA